MRNVPLLVCLLLLITTLSLGQGSQPVVTSPAAPYYSPDPLANISVEVTKMSVSVGKLTAQMKLFVDKFEKVGGMTFNEKQQKLILAMELISRAEARVAVLQKAQIDLTEKLNQSRNRLTQVEVDLRPASIERSVTFTGTTQTEELRDARKTRLQAERTNLTQLVQQITSNLAETNEALREAQILAARLRKIYLPQIEREMYEQ